MKTFVSVLALLSAVLAQTTFEPSDFNVTEALLENGVDISSIPELAELAADSDLAKRTIDSSRCRVAVRQILPSSLMNCYADNPKVQLVGTPFWR